MYGFFLNNTLAMGLFLIVILLLMYSVFNKRLKGYLLLFALIFYVIDITYLLVLGFTLLKSSIITGASILIILLSIKEGKNEF